MHKITTSRNRNTPGSQTYAILVLLFFIVILVLHHAFGYVGHFGYDDIHYAELSHNLLRGDVDFEDHATYRFPVILLTALFYRLFGISDLTSSLPALIVTIAILVIVFGILRKEGISVLITGLGLTTLSNWFLFYSDKLMPDIYVALSVVAAIAVIYHYKYRSHKQHPFIHALLLAFSLLFGFMSKGTIVLILPLLIYLFVFDMITNRDRKFWLYTIILGASLLVIYFGVIWWLTGDFFKRFEAITNNSYLNPCSYSEQPFRILLRRISFGFFQSLIRDSMAIGFVLILSILFRKGRPGYFKMNDSFSFFLVSSIILLLSSNFMTISVTSYSPMCLDPRHYLFLLPVVSIPASKIISQYLGSKAFRYQILAGLVLLFTVSLFLNSDLSWNLYLPVAGLLMLYAFIPRRVIFQHLFLVLFITVLLIKPFELISYARHVKYGKQKEIFKEYVMEQTPDCLVITNDVQKRLGYYYNAFNQEDGLEIVNYQDFTFDSTDIRKKILFLNWYTRFLSFTDKKDLPYFARNISPQNTLIYENEDLNIAIYEMSDFSIPEIEGKLLLTAFNDFESMPVHWTQNPENLTSEVSYSASHSNRVTRYSSTLTYPLDSLHLEDTGKLLVKADLLCYFEDITDAKLVVSIEDNKGAYIWEAKGVNRFIKAYSHWWPVSFEVEIINGQLKPDSELKVYLLNNERNPGYIDDFQVKLIEIDIR